MQIAVIADDFTGGLDAAGFMKKNGMAVILFSGIPGKEDISRVPDDSSIVIALQIRSMEKKSALKLVDDALDAISLSKCRMVYFKYCSTFDSTDEGNIGPIGDEILDRLNLGGTIVVPSLPVNGRTVKDGRLYVYGVPLASSHMRNHPLNPMTLSYVPEILQRQTERPVYLIKAGSGEKRKLYDKMTGFAVLDAASDEDINEIAKEFEDIPFATGGSALVGAYAGLYAKKGAESDGERVVEVDAKHAIMFVGSCSASSLKQVEVYESASHRVERFSLEKYLSSPDEYINALLEKAKGVEGRFPLLISASKTPREREENDKNFPGVDVARETEGFFAKMTGKCLESGFTRFIVGGGETSGSVVRASKLNAFSIGREISPGVSWMYSDGVAFALKSGNFGGDDFFISALLE